MTQNTQRPSYCEAIETRYRAKGLCTTTASDSPNHQRLVVFCQGGLRRPRYLLLALDLSRAFAPREATGLGDTRTPFCIATLVLPTRLAFRACRKDRHRHKDGFLHSHSQCIDLGKTGKSDCICLQIRIPNWILWDGPNSYARVMCLGPNTDAISSLLLPVRCQAGLVKPMQHGGLVHVMYIQCQPLEGLRHGLVPNLYI